MKRVASLGIIILAIAVTASLGIAAGRTVWHVAGETAIAPQDVNVQQDIAPLAVSYDIAPVTALAPFGSVSQPAPTAEQAAATTLDLALRGILLQTDPAQSSALIATDGSTLRYVIGDSIAGKAVLTEIMDRQVVLDVNGNPQTLGFPNADNLPLGDAQLSQTAAEAPEPSGLDRLRAALGVASGSIEIKDPPPPVTTDDYITMWRERIIRNPNQVLGEIGLLAGEKGYTIDETHDPGIKLAGLKAGDRVARVNGQAVGNVEQDRKFFDEVAASGVARLEVVRGDRTFVLSFPLR